MMSDDVQDWRAVLDGRREWAVVLGDCLDVLRELPAGSVDAVVTDPPYGIARVWKGGWGNGWASARSAAPRRNEWDASPPNSEHMTSLAAMCGRVVIWGGNHFELPPSRGWLVWTKPERGFSLSEAEIAWTNRDAVVRVWDGVRSDFGRSHPTQKPEALMRWCLDTIDVPADAVVFDPYCGSGTTGVACIQTGRRFIGVEIDPTYHAIAVDRLTKAAAARQLPLALEV